MLSLAKWKAKKTQLFNLSKGPSHLNGWSGRSACAVNTAETNKENFWAGIPPSLDAFVFTYEDFWQNPSFNEVFNQRCWWPEDHTTNNCL